jgi:hypothetical protein
MNEQILHRQIERFSKINAKFEIEKEKKHDKTDE